MTSNLVQVTFKLQDLPASVRDVLRWDSSLVVGVLGSIPQLGSWEPRRMLKADLSEDDVWNAVSHLSRDSSFTWTWVITARDGHVMFSDRVGQRETTMGCFSGILETIWGSHDTRFIAQTTGFMMRVHYRCKKDQVLAIVGSGISLGSWDPKSAILARESEPHSSIWTVEALIDNTVQRYQWKWVVLDKESGNVARWEERGYRHLEPQSDGLVTLIETRWNNDFRCEQRGTPEELNRYIQAQESSNTDINWLNNANCIMLPYEVSDDDSSMMAAAAKVAEPFWQSAMRQLPVLVLFMYEWSRF